MSNEFGQKLKELREKKFPGQGIRAVGENISARDSFGTYFFTQLSKFESGALSPSPDLLVKILLAYKASKEETDNLLSLLLTQLLLSQTELDIFRKHVVHKAVHQLHRKVKKKK